MRPPDEERHGRFGRDHFYGADQRQHVVGDHNGALGVQQNFQGGFSWPRIAGLSYEYLVSSMNAFATEQRTNNTDMVQFMKMFSEQERDAMARYLAGL